MTGEMSRADVTEEAYPMHFAIAKELGGTVEPFDVYQGPYVQLPGARLWVTSEDGIGAYVFNERTRRKSQDFLACELNGEEAIAAAREVYPEGGIDVDAPEPAPPEPTIPERLAAVLTALQELQDAADAVVNISAYRSDPHRKAMAIGNATRIAINALAECKEAP